MKVGEGNGNPLQYSCLGNPMDGGAWWAAVHEGQTQLSDFTFIFHFPALAGWFFTTEPMGKLNKELLLLLSHFSPVRLCVTP